MKLYRVAIAVCILAGTSLAQDPFKVAPHAYKLQFENEWVKVTRVRYAPREKLPAHEHTKTAAAYVYLNDGGPVAFKHIDKSYGSVTRPATKAGSFRVYHRLLEIHEVENKSDLPSEFLRVEFKTEPVNEKSLFGRYYREAYPAGEIFQKVQFENEQIRITRLVCPVGRKLEVSTTASEPSLLIVLSPADLKMSVSAGKARKVKLDLGQGNWVGLSQQAQFENVGGAPAEMLRFDFKTKPLSKDELDKNKKHEHSKN